MRNKSLSIVTLPQNTRGQQLLGTELTKGEKQRHKEQKQRQKAWIETNWTTQQENVLECS